MGEQALMIRLRVKEVAKEKEMSMGKLSRTADVAYRTVKLIYTDPYRDVSLSTLSRLAKALGVSVVDLIEELPDELG
jgi:DNA-binding Xre family transcriptional regulator